MFQPLRRLPFLLPATHPKANGQIRRVLAVNEQAEKHPQQILRFSNRLTSDRGEDHTIFAARHRKSLVIDVRESGTL
jgi:hypothetical protein